MFADRQCQCSNRQRSAPASRTMQAEGQSEQHSRPQFVQYEEIAVEPQRRTTCEQCHGQQSVLLPARLFPKPAPPRKQHGEREHKRCQRHSRAPQGGMKIGQCGQADRDGRSHRVIARALFRDDESVVALAFRDAFDHAIIEPQIVVALGCGHGGGTRH